MVRTRSTRAVGLIRVEGQARLSRGKGFFEASSEKFQKRNLRYKLSNSGEATPLRKTKFDFQEPIKSLSNLYWLCVLREPKDTGKYLFKNEHRN